MGDSMIDETYGQKFNFRKELFKVTTLDGRISISSEQKDRL